MSSQENPKKKVKKEESAFLKLPDELLRIIVQFVSQGDLFNFFRSCKTINRFVVLWARFVNNKIKNIEDYFHFNTINFDEFNVFTEENGNFGDFLEFLKEVSIPSEYSYQINNEFFRKLTPDSVEFFDYYNRFEENFLLKFEIVYNTEHNKPVSGIKSKISLFFGKKSMRGTVQTKKLDGNDLIFTINLLLEKRRNYFNELKSFYEDYKKLGFKFQRIHFQEAEIKGTRLKRFCVLKTNQEIIELNNNNNERRYSDVSGKSGNGLSSFYLPPNEFLGIVNKSNAEYQRETNDDLNNVNKKAKAIILNDSISSISNRLLNAKDDIIENQNRKIEEQDKAIEKKNFEIEVKNEELEVKNEELEAKDEELEAKKEELKAKKEELKAKKEELKAKDWELERLRKALEEHERRN